MRAVFVLTDEEVTEMAEEAIGRALAPEETERVCELVADALGMVWCDYTEEAIRLWIDELRRTRRDEGGASGDGEG